MEKALKSPKLLICECCAFNCITKKDFIRHLLTAKHKKLYNLNPLEQNNPKIFSCKVFFVLYIYRIYRMEKTFKILKKYICVSCDFECSQKCDINRHNLTAKHKKRCNSNNLEQKDIKNFVCKKCGKSYNARNSLWYHSQKCLSFEEKNPTNEVISLLIDENPEIKELLFKLYNNTKYIL
jgi:hypothetical protein